MPFSSFRIGPQPIRYRGVCSRCSTTVQSFYADAMDDHLELAHGIAYSSMTRAPLLPRA